MEAQRRVPAGRSANTEADVFALVTAIVQALATTKDQAVIEVHPELGGFSIRVRTSSEDLGQLIGKQGRTARAIRVILSAITSRCGLKFHLELGKHGEDSCD